ncbi:MAG TPA: hypothetical protein PKV17_12040, partial [Aquabacterium sp.]|nr:hypothetical protein [Aquabacterium sp.]
MKARSPRPVSPQKMDIGAFIESLAELQGQLTLGEVPRIAAGLAPEVPPADVPPITWRAQGELVAQRVARVQEQAAVGALGQATEPGEHV